MIVSVSAYLISFLKKINIHKFFLILLFILLIFYPFQYTSVEFRLLRQIIYPWIILMTTVSFSYIAYYLFRNATSKLDTKIFIHSIIFGASLFLFNYTREEGIWLFPVILIFLILVIFLSFKKKNLIHLLKTLLLSFCTYFLFYLLLISLNFFAYKTTTITEFKNPDYVYGYSSLFLAGIDEDTFYAPSKETWNEIYAVSPSARELKSYIDSNAYSSWSKTGCNGLRNAHHRSLRDLDCDNKMVSAFFLWAIRDAIWEAGYRTPNDVFKFMRNLGDEIHIACNSKKIACKKTFNIMTPQYTFDFTRYTNIFSNIKLAIKLSRLSNRANDAISHPPEINIYKISSKLNSKAFRPKIEKKNKPDDFSLSSYVILDEAGWVDYISYDGKAISIYGWAFDHNIFDKIFVVGYGKKLCETKPNIIRKDITNDFDNIGFKCSFDFKLITDKSVNIDVFAVRKQNLYPIKKTELVEYKLFNRFDQDCYLKKNSDIKVAIEKGLFSSAYEHYEKHGYKENRVCTPLLNKDNNISIDESIYLKKHEKFALELNSVFIKIYSLINLLAPLTFLGIIYFIYKRYWIELLLSLGLLSIYVLRILLMSIMETLYFAPLAPAYLATATFFYYLFLCIVLIILLSKVSKKS